MKIMLCLGLTFFLVSASCKKSREQTSSDSDTESIAKMGTQIWLQAVVGTDGKDNKAICSYETTDKQRANPDLFISPKVPVPGLIKADDLKNAQTMKDAGIIGIAGGIFGALVCTVFAPCFASATAAGIAVTVTSVSVTGMVVGGLSSDDKKRFSGNVSNAVGFAVTKEMYADHYADFINKLKSLPPAKGLECKNVQVAKLMNPGK
jgi:hypothetical protein